ncbi:MAG: hypothetical protein LBG18_02785 [Mediterranea sp.]|jgi:hypothetical protein|nr:hypothetical protein [Mediterranea sp.]
MVKYSTLKLRLNLTFLISALLFVSCSGDEKNPDGEEEKPVSVPVRFSSGLSGWVEGHRERTTDNG